MKPATGVLLLNLGTPDNPDVPAVRRYLRQFLSDERVIDIPKIPRWLLLNLVILPFRPRQSSEAYKTIWTDRGSPLLFHTEDIAKAVTDQLGDNYSVKFAMRYQNPSLEAVLQEFHDEGVERIVVMPMYPQYASSSTGSCLEALYKAAGALYNTPHLTVIPPFSQHPVYQDCLAEVCRESLGDLDRFDHFLFSYHGLPERQVKKSQIGKEPYCLASDNCCDAMNLANRFCYRAQSYEATRQLVRRLGISEDRYSVAFQSRLGRTPWIRPYTDEVLAELPKKGIKRLAVAVPSFTADCLETIEEIGMRGRETFEEAGGEELHLVPCLNAHPLWVKAVGAMVQEML